MEHSQQDLDRLIDRYLSDEATAEERNMLEQSYMKASSGTQIGDVRSYDAARLNKIGLQTWETLIDRMDQHGQKRAVLWLRIVAAAAVIALVVGVYFFNDHHDRKSDGALQANDIAPGKRSATLTLADGRRIVLSDALNGKLAEQAGVNISKTAAGQVVYQAVPISGAEAGLPNMNVISTAKAEQYQLVLPDGTEVWLNAASSLKFPATFSNAKTRKVELLGEAYFQVAKDKKHPFLVKSKGQEVEVLGTHFNVKSYTDETSVKTTLLEGSVRVNEVILKPSQQAVLTGTGQITVKQVDVRDVIDWKNAEFVFKGEQIRDIMTRVAKWYDVDVVYLGDVPTEGFNGVISRNKKISQVLKMLEETNAVHFRIEGRRVYVSK